MEWPSLERFAQSILDPVLIEIQQDQESSSEDVMSAFAMKMWGTVTGDANMMAR